MRALLIFKKAIQKFQQSGFALVAMIPYMPEVPTAVGEWNGSSCVAIATNWAIASKHQGGWMGSYLKIQGQPRTVIQLIDHPTSDIQLVQFAEPVTAWHPVRSTLRQNDFVYLGGHGMQGDVGQPWRYPREERWGTNIISTDGNFLATRFTAPSEAGATPHEAQFAMNDSGGGLFSLGSNGKFYLEGLAISISGGGGSGQYGQTGFALNMSLAADWIYQNINGGVDSNRDGLVNVEDIFAYLSDWFSLQMKADINRDATVSIDDLQLFLSRWFQSSSASES